MNVRNKYREKSTSTRNHSEEKDLKIEYKIPTRPEIRIIDFGGAMYTSDAHSGTINTRQYRSPEVIMNFKWNEKSDIWSLGCIFSELYTGEILFPTHSNLEHLCMIESMCGMDILYFRSFAFVLGEVYSF